MTAAILALKQTKPSQAKLKYLIKFQEKLCKIDKPHQQRILKKQLNAIVLDIVNSKPQQHWLQTNAPKLLGQLSQFAKCLANEHDRGIDL